MSSIILLGFGLIFLHLAYNTLLHFYGQDKQCQPFPVREMIVPWPSRGKFVSILAGLVGCFFIWAWLVTPVSRIDIQKPRQLVLALALVVMPNLLMASFYWHRIKRDAAGVMMYIPAAASPIELRIPSLVTAALTGGALLWQWIRM